eukprot:1145688-Pelagomonas_calceolata.AAC.3
MARTASHPGLARRLVARFVPFLCVCLLYLHQHAHMALCAQSGTAGWVTGVNGDSLFLLAPSGVLTAFRCARPHLPSQPLVRQALRVTPINQTNTPNNKACILHAPRDCCGPGSLTAPLSGIGGYSTLNHYLTALSKPPLCHGHPTLLLGHISNKTALDQHTGLSGNSYAITTQHPSLVYTSSSTGNSHASSQL